METKPSINPAPSERNLDSRGPGKRTWILGPELWKGCVALFFGYLLGAELGYFFNPTEDPVTVIWPPGPIYASIMLAYPISGWPALVLTAIAANLFSDIFVHKVEWTASLGFCLANSITAITGAFFIQRTWGVCPPLGSVAKAARIMGVLLFTGPLLAALVGGSVITFVLHGEPFPGSYLRWLGSDWIGFLLFFPWLMLFLWGQETSEINSKRIIRWLEGILILVVVATLSHWVFDRKIPAPLAYAILGFLLWPAVRMGPTSILTCNLITVGIACHYTRAGLGIFSMENDPFWKPDLILQLFIGVSSLTSWLVHFTVRDRTVAIHTLLKLNQDLEQKVKTRTTELENKRAELQMTFDHSPIGKILLLEDGTILQANASMGMLLGEAPARLQGRNMGSWLKPEVWNDVIKNLQVTFAKQGVWPSWEMDVQPAQGPSIHCMAMAGKVPVTRGGKHYAVLQLIDITQATRDRKRMVESEERFQLISETIDDVFWISHIDLRENFYVSSAYERIWGRRAEDLAKNPGEFLLSIHPEDRERAKQNLEKQKQGLPFFSEYRIVRPNGEIRFIWDRGYPVKEPDGRIKCFVGVARDVTERVENEQKIRVVQERLSLALESGSLGVWDWDTRNPEVHCCDSIYRMLGYEPGEFPFGLALVDKLIHPQDQQMVKDRFEAMLTGKTEKYLAEYRIQTKSGAWRWHVATGKVVQRDPAGGAMRVVGTQTDVTLLKRMKEDLELSEKRFEILIENAPVGVFRAGPNGEGQYVNPAWCEITGCPREEALGSGWVRAIHPEDRKEVLEKWEKSLEDQTDYHHEFRVQRPDGTFRWVTARGVRIPDPATQELCTIGITTDITEKKEAIATVEEVNRLLEKKVEQRTEELTLANAELTQANLQLARSDKFKDEFLARMSHELRTPLNGILGITEAMREEVYGPVNAEQNEALGDVERSGRHLLSLINDILDLSKIQAGQFKLNKALVSVDEVFQASLNMVKSLAQKKQIQIHWKKTPDLFVYADARVLKQILVNLLGNAVKFTLEKGEIGMEVTPDPQNQVLSIAVWDHGIGITQDHQKDLFVPFHQVDSRLARKYSGTGLGLALVQRMAQLHGGTVKVESVPDQGSRFTVTLPWNPQWNQTLEERKVVLPEKVKRVLVVGEGFEEFLPNLVGAEELKRVPLDRWEESLSHEDPDLVLLGLGGENPLAQNWETKLGSDPRLIQVPVVLTGRTRTPLTGVRPNHVWIGEAPSFEEFSEGCHQVCAQPGLMENSPVNPQEEPPR